MLSSTYKAWLRIKNRRLNKLPTSNEIIKKFLDRNKENIIYASIADYHTFVMRYDVVRNQWFRYESTGKKWVGTQPEQYFKNMISSYLHYRYGLKGKGYRLNLTISFAAIKNPDRDR